jgi:hypothetical protein
MIMPRRLLVRAAQDETAGRPYELRRPHEVSLGALHVVFAILLRSLASLGRQSTLERGLTGTSTKIAVRDQINKTTSFKRSGSCAAGSCARELCYACGMSLSRLAPACNALTLTLTLTLLGAPAHAHPHVIEQATFDLVAGELSGERAQELDRRIVEHHRIQGSPMMADVASAVVLPALREAGVEARIETFPSDGKTRYQSFVSPMGWTIRGGELWVEGEMWTHADELDKTGGAFQISAAQYARLKAKMATGPVRVRGTIDATLAPGGSSRSSTPGSGERTRTTGARSLSPRISITPSGAPTTTPAAPPPRSRSRARWPR